MIKTICMVTLAILGGMIFGILIRYWLDRNILEDAYIEWEDDHKAEIDFYRKREERMAAEISRLHIRETMRQYPKKQIRQEKNSPEWLAVLENTDDPDWIDVDFGKEW